MDGGIACHLVSNALDGLALALFQNGALAPLVMVIFSITILLYYYPGHWLSKCNQDFGSISVSRTLAQ